MNRRDTLLAASLLSAVLAPAAEAQQLPSAPAARPRVPEAAVARPLARVPVRSRDWLAGNAVGAFHEPATETEKTLAAIWREVLRVDRVGANDGFLSLGGHSLAALQAVRRIEAGLGVRVPMRVLMANSSVGQLAEALDHERGAGSRRG